MLRHSAPLLPCELEESTAWAVSGTRADTTPADAQDSGHHIGDDRINSRSSLDVPLWHPEKVQSFHVPSVRSGRPGNRIPAALNRPERRRARRRMIFVCRLCPDGDSAPTMKQADFGLNLRSADSVRGADRNVLVRRQQDVVGGSWGRCWSMTERHRSACQEGTCASCSRPAHASGTPGSKLTHPPPDVVWTGSSRPVPR